MKEPKDLQEDFENNWLPTDSGWVKAMRSVSLKGLWSRGHGASVLLWIVAVRAWRGAGISPLGCMPGESLVGDWASCGFTHKAYRIAKKQLEEMKLCSFRANNKGTIAKLLSPEIFDINLPEDVTERTSEGKQGANEGQTEGKQGANRGQTEGKQGANEGHLTRSEELKKSELEQEKKLKKKEINNSAGGADNEFSPSAGEPEESYEAASRDLETNPRVAESIPGGNPEVTPTQKAVELSKELPHYLKAVCGYQSLPVFSRDTLIEAKEFFERNPILEFWDVGAAIARAIKLSRENPSPATGKDPYYISRRFAGRPNKLFSRTAEGDLYLARLLVEVKYDTKRGESFEAAQDLFDMELKRVVELKKLAKKAALVPK